MVKYLTLGGADINGRDNVGLPCLIQAASSGLLDRAEILLHFGANVNIRDENGFTPLHVAAIRQNEPMLKLLLKAGADRHAKNKRGQTASDFTRRPQLLALLNADDSRRASR